jgi:replication initiator protein A
MSAEHAAQTGAVSSQARPGKDEMNFAEFPIALLTDRVPRGQKSIKFENQLYDERRKKLITQKRVIEGSEEYGLPTATDDFVILGLIQLTKLKTDFRHRELEFTRLELIRMLGWPDEGASYDRIKLSLQRIANVTYNYDNAWWDGRQRTWTTKIFHIIDTVEINDSRGSDGQRSLFPSRIVWNEVVFDSFQSGFLRNIDFELCMRLEHPTALRMYRFLGKRFHHKPTWTFDLKEFAYDHIGLGRNYEGGIQIARKLQPAIAELENIGFLEPLAGDQRFQKQGRDWSIHFVQKNSALDILASALPDVSNPSESTAARLVAELTNRGVTKATAAELVQRHPNDAIEAKIDVFDWLVEKQDKRVAKSPAGYLVKSVSNDYMPPKGYLPKAQRQKQEEARRAAEQEATQDHRRQREKAAREKAERAAIAAYWESLTPEQQAELDNEALAQADPEALALETGPLKRLGKQIRRDQFIRQLLKNRDAIPAEA